MGSRILSRSFHVERWEGEDEDSDENQSPSVAADKSDDMDIDTTKQDPREDEEVEGGAESDDEDKEDPSDVAMVPLADMLNARYQSENVRVLSQEWCFAYILPMSCPRRNCAMNPKICRWFAREISSVENKL
jgi:N-lysine methyltransferase SETD6